MGFTRTWLTFVSFDLGSANGQTQGKVQNQMQHLYTSRCCDGQALRTTVGRRTGDDHGDGPRWPESARHVWTLHIAPSTISREWLRNSPSGEPWQRREAGRHEGRRRRFRARQAPKLALEGVLFGVVEHFLREGWSPGKIASALKMMRPDAPERRVSMEAIYTCLYALPRGALRQELIACLRKGRSTRLPRARGTD